MGFRALRSWQLAPYSAQREAQAAKRGLWSQSGYDFSGWIGLLGPANMPRELVAKLHAETVKALGDEALSRQLVDLGFDMLAARRSSLHDS